MNNLDQARKWAKEVSEEYFTYITDDSRAAIKVIQSLPDQIVDGEKVREIYDRYRASEITLHEAFRAAVALTAPSLPTLAELIELGNKPEDYQWAWVDTKDGLQVITTAGDFDDEHAYVMDKDGRRFAKGWSQIRPRPDLPRLEWPGGGMEGASAGGESMTTNEDLAQRIVGGVIDRLTTDKSGVPVATRITQALADAGLLMPDLPEPSGWQDGSFTGWLLNEDVAVKVNQKGAIIIEHMDVGWFALPPEDASRFADMIKSAATLEERDNK